MRSLSQNAGFLNWIVGDTEVIIVLLWYTKNGVFGNYEPNLPNVWSAV